MGDNMVGIQGHSGLCDGDDHVDTVHNACQGACGGDIGGILWLDMVAAACRIRFESGHNKMWTDAPLFISASVLGYALLGQYPSDVQMRYTMGYWFLCALPWFLFVSVANYIVIVRRYGPKSDAAKKDLVVEIKAEKPGPMSGKEKYMLVVMSTTMLLWTTEHLHGVPAYIVAMAALCLTLAGNVYDRAAFRADINWDSLIFIGAVLGLSSVFSYLGINIWIVEMCTPVFSTLAANPYLLVLGIGVMTVLLRFVIVSELAFVNIFMVFMVPVAVGLGINPWVVGFAVYGLINPWFFMYQNPVYMAAYYAVDGKMSEHGSIAKYCVTYSLICLAGLALSVPFWMGIGAWGM